MPHAGTNCIDNNEATMCHSLTQANPWISIELPADSSWSPARVSQVVIYNRFDCCWDRLMPFQLWVGQHPGDYNSNTSTACGVNLTVLPTRGPFTFECGVNRTAGTGSPLLSTT